MYVLKHLSEDFQVNEISKEGRTGAKHAVYLLTKRDMSTPEALQLVATTVHIPSHAIGYAGLKDKRAVTSQYISIPAHYNLKETYTFGSVSLERVRFQDERLYPGFLEGNAFTLVIRNLTQPLCPQPMPLNYFGEQRFSTHNVAIGRAILLGNLAEAIRLIKDSGHSLSEKSHHHGTLMQLPKHLFRMYLHAYQSYLWNTCVSRLHAAGHLTENMRIPLIGFDLEEFLGDEVTSAVRGCIEAIMREENITYRDFILRQFPDMGLVSSLREVYIAVTDLQLGQLVSDTYFPNCYSCTVSFVLPKGSYATVFVKQIVADVDAL